ncbi:MAG: hypothetical protein ACE5KE_06360 [Methanosarcinales archaeon]
MIEYLVELGKKAGFKVWTAHRNDKINKIAEYELQLSISSERLQRIKEIDVLWISDNVIEYAFEVENTTTITEAINRVSNIEYEIKRVIVIPEERIKFLKRKIKDPMLKERIEKEQWNIIVYGYLERFYNQNKTKKSINIDDFKINNLSPKYANQLTLDIFKKV